MKRRTLRHISLTVCFKFHRGNLFEVIIKYFLSLVSKRVRLIFPFSLCILSRWTNNNFSLDAELWRSVGGLLFIASLRQSQRESGFIALFQQW